MKKSLFNVVIPLKRKEHLIHNTVTQRSILLNEYESSKYISEDFDDLLLNLRLRDMGAIVSEDLDEVEKLKNDDLSSKKTDEKSLHLTLMMTEACNFGCSYCNQGHDKASNFMAEDVFNSICNYIKDFSNLETLNITWYGGEPLIRKKDIMKYSTLINGMGNELGFKYSSDIITNGYLLDIQTAKSLVNSGVNCAQITIDGCEEDHDNSRYIKEGQRTYQRIIDNIKNAINETQLNIVIRVNVNPLNQSNLSMLVDDLINQGVVPNKQVGIYFANIYSAAKNGLNSVHEDEGILSAEKFAAIQFQMNRYCWKNGIKVALDMPAYQGACIATKKSSYAINPNGSLHKCYIVMANDEEKVGTLQDNGANLINSRFEHWNSWTAFEQEECSGCKLLGSCRGGCPLDFIQDSESDNESKVYRCPPAKLYFNEYIFQRAVGTGVVDHDKWDENSSKTSLMSLRITK